MSNDPPQVLEVGLTVQESRCLANGRAGLGAGRFDETLVSSGLASSDRFQAAAEWFMPSFRQDSQDGFKIWFNPLHHEPQVIHPALGP